MISSSYSSQSTHPTGRVFWEVLLVLSRFHSYLRADECGHIDGRIMSYMGKTWRFHEKNICAPVLFNLLYINSFQKMKTCPHQDLRNNKGTDQPAHPRRLISALVMCLLDCIISRLATSKFSSF